MNAGLGSEMQCSCTALFEQRLGRHVGDLQDGERDDDDDDDDGCICMKVEALEPDDETRRVKLRCIAHIRLR